MHPIYAYNLTEGYRQLFPWQESFLADPYSPESQAWMRGQGHEVRRTGRSLVRAHWFVRLAVGEHLGARVIVTDHEPHLECTNYVMDMVIHILEKGGISATYIKNSFRVFDPHGLNPGAKTFVDPVDRARNPAYRGL